MLLVNISTFRVTTCTSMINWIEAVVKIIDLNQFVLKDQPVKISPLPGFIILQGFGKICRSGLAESTICLISHKAPKTKTWEVYLQIRSHAWICLNSANMFTLPCPSYSSSPCKHCHVGIVLHPNLYGKNWNVISLDLAFELRIEN